MLSRLWGRKLGAGIPAATCRRPDHISTTGSESEHVTQHKSQRVEATQVSIRGCMGEQNVAYTGNGV